MKCYAQSLAYQQNTLKNLKKRRLDEVSDPEMWMGLHHFSSDSEDEEDAAGDVERPSGSTRH